MALSSVSPMITVKNVKRSLAWYEDVLGFTPEQQMPDERRPLFGIARRDDVMIMFSTGADPFAGTKPPRALVNAVATRAAQKVVHLYLETNSLRADYNRAVKRGGKILAEPMKMPWGDREFRVQDPNGYVVHVLQPAPARR
ncbi:MAG: VOC family protein [Chloroflexi bacterium]|nr:VOC family protein [Chloroflexota bacterium]